jgi:response regulator of citrate/malate metabolism
MTAPPVVFASAAVAFTRYDGTAVKVVQRNLEKQVGVSRVTAWRYLERLADEGTVTRHTDYGKAGRPKTRYQWG